MPIRNIAEEAAAKAKQVHLQSLRDKVYGKGGTKENPTKVTDKGGEDPPATKAADEDVSPDNKNTNEKSLAEAAADALIAPEAAGPGKEEEATAASSSASVSASASASSLSSKVAGLQSPTTGTWADGAGGPSALDRMLQSPTSTSWRPTDVDPPVTSYRGSMVSSASADQIEAIEKAEMIREEPEEGDAEPDETEEANKRN